MQTNYGFPHLFKPPPDLDFYVLSNEDIGFIANLVTGTNDVFAFALPYPSSIDLFDETIVVHAIEFIFQSIAKPTTGTSVYGLLAFLSMLDKEFSPTFLGVGADTEDENLKAQFAGNIYFGYGRTNITAVASVEGTERNMDSMVKATYFPPIPLDLVTPLYIQFVNQSATITLATNASAMRDFDQFEKVYLRVWFTTRKLTESEKSARAMQVRWQRLDS